MEDTFDVMGQAMEETCQELTQEELSRDELNQELQVRYSKRVDEATVKVFESYDVTREGFHNATLQYGQDPTFLNKMRELQDKQTLRFRSATSSLNLEG